MTDTPNETWRPIPGFPGYSVSDLGRVRSESRTVMRDGTPVRLNGRILSGSPNSDGYPHFGARRDGKTVMVRVHQAVMWAFVGPQERGVAVRHIDGTRANCALTNLAYGTRAQNVEDARAQGVFRPENMAASKLTTADAIAIAGSDEPAAVLAEKYGVAKTTIHHVRGGSTWRIETADARAERARRRMHPSKRLTAEQMREIAQSLSLIHI